MRPDEAQPAFRPVDPGVDRPTWSVMIPTYNASSMLEQALRSVLDQDPGAGSMQIAVVDDCSPNGEAERIVERIAPGRVEFHRNPANVGLAGNWDSCIDQARGRWVHILHQDDLVLPGFYERLGVADRERPDVGAAFTRHFFMDEDGHWTHLSRIERREAGVLDDWLAKLSAMQLIQCASIVVRRDVYEQVGGYRRDLKMALDWEMWVRIAARYPVWFEPKPLAGWRVHSSNESSRLVRAGAHIPDVFRAIEVIRGYLPDPLKEGAGRELLAQIRHERVAEAARLMTAGARVEGMEQFRQACLCDPSLKNSREGWNFRKWALKLWVRERLSGSSKAASMAAGS